MHCFVVVILIVPYASESMPAYPHVNIKFISRTVPVLGLNVRLNKSTQ